MAAEKPEKPKVVAFRDHEVITPDTRKLRKAVRAPIPGEADQLQLAEQALGRLAGDFSVWMHDECDRVNAARRNVRKHGLTDENCQELFLAAHNIKGDASTFGFPELVGAADSLCRLLEHTPDLSKVPTAIIDQHVDALRAIVREHKRPDIAAIASALSEKLRAVTDEFLLAENQDRPDVLRLLQSPPLVP